MANPSAEPVRDCVRCPRLAAFRAANRAAEPAWHNAPVATFTSPSTELLIIGLAPGLKGANRTGRPFTGDYAGDLLYATLLKFGFARGVYGASPDDGLKLVRASITNAVRCVPPENKPTTTEIAACRDYLGATIANLPRLKAMVALGRIAHDSTLTALTLRKSAFPFGHGRKHAVRPGVTLYDSYHCSRYNTNTGVLTEAMFENVFSEVRNDLGISS